MKYLLKPTKCKAKLNPILFVKIPIDDIHKISNDLKIHCLIHELLIKGGVWTKMIFHRKLP